MVPHSNWSDCPLPVGWLIAKLSSRYFFLLNVLVLLLYKCSIFLDNWLLSSIYLLFIDKGESFNKQEQCHWFYSTFKGLSHMLFYLTMITWLKWGTLVSLHLTFDISPFFKFFLLCKEMKILRGIYQKKSKAKVRNACGLVRTANYVDLLFAQCSSEINLIVVTLL